MMEAYRPEFIITKASRRGAVDSFIYLSSFAVIIFFITDFLKDKVTYTKRQEYGPSSQQNTEQ